MKKMIALGTLALLMHYSRAQAQDNTNDLDPVTVTTSFANQKASQTGRNLFVIRGDRFQNLPVHSIDELLRYLPGIEIQARGPFGAQSDIVMRGGTFQQVLVIVDGMRVNDANTGHFSSYIPISPAEIDRIEVLKGASSAVYGADAVGGVIHVITKTYAAKRGEKKSAFGVQASAGAYDLFAGNTGGFHHNGTTAIGGGLLSNNTSGQLQRGTRGSVYAHTGSFSLQHHLSERLAFRLRYAYDTRNFGAQNFYTSFLSDTAREKVSTHWAQAGLRYSGNRHQVELNAGYKNLDDRFRFNTVSIPNENNSKLIQALLTDQWKWSEKTTLVLGAQYLNKQIASNDRGNHQLGQGALFTVLQHQFTPGFFVSPALRADWNEVSGWELVPQVNAAYRVASWQFRASGGKTIRDADYTERFNNYGKPVVTGGRIGNPDLALERSLSYEAGVDYYLSGNWKFTAGFFQRRHKRLIDWVNTPYADMPRKDNLLPTGSYALAKNIAEVNTTGVETELQFTRNFSAQRRLWATLGLTWLKSRSSDAQPSLYVSSHARFLANFAVQATAGRFSLGLTGLYKNRAPQSVASPAIAKVSEDYLVLNLRGEGMIVPNRFSVFVQADNLLDTKYTDLLGAPMPGIWLMGGIKISLTK